MIVHKYFFLCIFFVFYVFCFLFLSYLRWSISEEDYLVAKAIFSPEKFRAKTSGKFKFVSLAEMIMKYSIRKSQLIKFYIKLIKLKNEHFRRNKVL